MSTLLDRGARSGAPVPDPSATGRSPVAAAVLAAVQASGAALVAVLAPVVLAWSVVPSTHSSWAHVVRIAVDGWLLAHHTGIAVVGGHVGIVPLGLLGIVLSVCWLAGLRLARAADPRADAIRAGVGRARPVMPPPRALITFVGTYTAVVTVASAVVASPDARPLAAQALIGSALVATVGGVAGAAAWPAGGLVAGLRLCGAGLRLPAQVLGWARPAALALAVQLGAGLVLVLVALVAGWDRVAVLHRALDPGLGGSVALVVLQLALLPNLVVWGAAVAAGPGFAVGAGTAITPAASVLGPLPALPVLGGLPVPGTHPSWSWAVLAVPVLAGAVMGLYVVRSVPRARARLWAEDAAGSAGLAAVLLAVLGWLSGGPAGPGRLAEVGPSAWRLGLAFGVEALLGALTVVLVSAMVRQARSGRTG